ncbi:MAG: hypothetical protein V3S07_05705 [Micropepsaceae bacterium]
MEPRAICAATSRRLKRGFVDLCRLIKRDAGKIGTRAYNRLRRVALRLPEVHERRSHRPTSSSGTFSGWLGVFLDHTGEQDVNRDQIASLLEDAFRMPAPKSLIAELDERRSKAL